MKSELKKEFAMRISQANNVQMIIIAYEMAETYINDAVISKDEETVYVSNIDMAIKCIDELKANLHYKYEISVSLKNLYLYCNSRLRDAKYNKDYDALDEVNKLIKSLRESYEKVQDVDPSAPLMSNAQIVVAGMTYGRNQILDELSNDVNNRGFLV